ncbi:restriction endonuclease subunit S [Maritalea mobilis]|uniref:restriction endonuclease subunit S n=1 Tax=Maritalea mobilis TaxID=483324 RepID=UPI001C9400A0|nr:restriction endonuclease subunit S [Maritalea mobilis]MBY6202836.1 restriction endonuclease subunit S [Maritalea mobilis]
MFPKELDTNSLEGLTRLFWFAVNARNDDVSRAAVPRLQDRLDLTAHEPSFRGAFEDAVRHLDSLEPTRRFEAVYSLIDAALKYEERLQEDLAREILRLLQDKRIIRFSFARSLMLGLRHAQTIRQTRSQRYPGYNIRYAGVGPDRELMAIASLYLDLPIYTETGPPWAPDTLFDDGEPNFEMPELEVSFPPASFRASDAPGLEAGIRKLMLPRAVNRGTYDLESAMLAYLGATDSSALAMVSDNFLFSPGQSRLATRQRLLDMRCIYRVAELQAEKDSQYMISLNESRISADEVQMISTRDVQRFIGAVPFTKTVRKRATFVSVEEIQTAGGSLLPKRYLSAGPVGGPNFVTRTQNAMYATEYRLADLFEIIRPKTIRNDPVGTLQIQEVSGINISHFGEILGTPRNVTVRSTLEERFEEQRLKPGDIVFAHRGPIGRVAYLSEQSLEGTNLWAGQTLFVFRERKRFAEARDVPYCDPRVLFMYLLTPMTLESWKNVSNGGRSPSIPIGEVERFMVPKSLATKSKPKRTSASAKKGTATEKTVDHILAEFEHHQKKTEELRTMESQMHDGLHRVWDTAWRKP